MGEDHGRDGRASRGGPAHGWLFEPTFNRSIKLRYADPRITSDAGAPLLREADHRLGLTADWAARLIDPRGGPIGFAARRSSCSAGTSTPRRWATPIRTMPTRWPTTWP